MPIELFVPVDNGALIDSNQKEVTFNPILGPSSPVDNNLSEQLPYADDKRETSNESAVGVTIKSSSTSTQNQTENTVLESIVSKKRSRNDSFNVDR